MLRSLADTTLVRSAKTIPIHVSPRVKKNALLRPVSTRFKRSADGESGGDRWKEIVLYTSADPQHGGLCPWSQSALMALLEKQLKFREVKVRMFRRV